MCKTSDSFSHTFKERCGGPGYPRGRGSGAKGWVWGREVDRSSQQGADMRRSGRQAGSSSESASLDERELRSLLELSQSMYHQLNFDEMVSYVVKRVRDLVDSQAVSVLLHDEAEDMLVFSWIQDEHHAAALSQLKIPTHSGIAGRVFKTGRPELIDDVSRETRHYAEIDGRTGFQTRSLVAVPLQGVHRRIGVIEALNKTQGSFTEKDLHFLSSMAALIGTALDNARMHSELLRAYERLKLDDHHKALLIEEVRNRNSHLQQELQSLYRFDEIRGSSEGVRALLKLCEKAVHSDITVHIEGETGTGKELVARTIHYNSRRRDAPFVTQNCGSIPENLLASELFGYRKGAFTGAVKDKKGLFEVADGGTVFLDEVAEMPLQMQVSLLRTLEEREIKPLGAEHPVKVDVRVLSATNRPLEECVKAGTFREDLFYRLSVFNIRIPPLRERTDDIPLLAHHFVNELNGRNRTSFKGLTPEALRLLSSYPFPGNVRELRNEVERAMAMAVDGEFIGPLHFSERVLIATGCRGGGSGNRSDTLKQKVEAMERREIIQALASNGGNKSKTAAALGLSRVGLMKKMNRYKL